VLFDVLLWNVAPPALVSDALWFSVMAVMCRVHSLALVILVGCQVVSLFLIFGMQGAFGMNNFSEVRYGVSSVAMLVIMACAYSLDEQSRLQSFGQLMSLQDKNAALADQLMRWKFIPETGIFSGGVEGPTGKEVAQDDYPSSSNNSQSSRSCLKAPRPVGHGAQAQSSTARPSRASPRRDCSGVRFSIPRQTTPGGTDLSALVPTSRPRTLGAQLQPPGGALPMQLCDVME
jgi:hypothetical protein